MSKQKKQVWALKLFWHRTAGAPALLATFFAQLFVDVTINNWLLRRMFDMETQDQRVITKTDFLNALLMEIVATGLRFRLRHSWLLCSGQTESKQTSPAIACIVSRKQHITFYCRTYHYIALVILLKIGQENETTWTDPLLLWLQSPPWLLPTTFTWTSSPD